MEADIRPILEELATGAKLSETQAGIAFDCLMSGNADLAQTGAFLMALRLRGETVDEITAGARALRNRGAMLTAPYGAIDTCGTGGDGLKTYNISTAAAIVTAACGMPVAKHGNRSVSSKSGSSDVLMALGAYLDVPLEAHNEALERFKFSFLFAPRHHQAVRHVASARGSLKMRTIFNLLGPLANPAGTKRQLLGVYDETWLVPMAEVLHRLGSDRVWVVKGRDGLDEISISGPTDVAALEDGKITEFEITPEMAGLETSPIAELIGGNAEDNAEAMTAVLEGKPSAYRDIVLINAGAALAIGQQATSIKEGVQYAAQAIDDGSAHKLFKDWAAFTQTFNKEL